MLIILSQKVDSESSYSDELFRSYHYPARYRNQIHKGDTFVYYQGNRYDKSQRYYFGIGTVGEILTTDGENYYAKLIDCQRFEKKVPIYLPDGGYIEQLGYETIRNSINPPWQSSVRPISQQAFDYILNVAGVQLQAKSDLSLDELKNRLMKAVKDFYVEKEDSAIIRIENIAASIARFLDITDDYSDGAEVKYHPSETAAEKLASLIEYCSNMKMSYSYKPILILALLNAGDTSGNLSIENAVKYFRKYYNMRKKQGLCVEIKKCIYQNEEVTDKQIAANLIANPVRVLSDTEYFFYNPDTAIFSMSPEIWDILDRKVKTQLVRICNQKLKTYYND